MRRYLQSLGVLFVLMTWVLVGVAQENACLWVEPGQSIQAAIDAAPPGSIVCLPEGKWVESIRITKTITLRGQGAERTVIQAHKDGAPVVWIDGKVKGEPINVVIEGVTIVGLALEERGGAKLVVPANFAVLATGYVQLVLKNCTINNAMTGVYLTDDVQGLITKIELKVENLGPYLKGSGIEVWGRAQATVVDATIVGPDLMIGILADAQAQLNVQRVTVTAGEIGLWVRGEAQTRVADARIMSQSNTGILATYRAQVGIARSFVSECENGLMIRGDAQVRLVESTVVNCNGGVTVLGSSSLVLLENRIAGNNYGVLIPPIGEPHAQFSGFVCGARNVIPGPEEPGGNRLGAFYVEDLSFLVTEEGGAWSRR